MHTEIKVGQRWKTRSGELVRVTCDRRINQLMGSDSWPWALSNSDMVDQEGHADVMRGPHPHDLVELIEEQT